MQELMYFWCLSEGIGALWFGLDNCLNLLHHSRSQQGDDINCLHVLLNLKFFEGHNLILLFRNEELDSTADQKSFYLDTDDRAHHTVLFFPMYVSNT